MVKAMDTRVPTC